MQVQTYCTWILHSVHIRTIQTHHINTLCTIHSKSIQPCPRTRHLCIVLPLSTLYSNCAFKDCSYCKNRNCLYLLSLDLAHFLILDSLLNLRSFLWASLMLNYHRSFCKHTVRCIFSACPWRLSTLNLPHQHCPNSHPSQPWTDSQESDLPVWPLPRGSLFRPLLDTLSSHFHFLISDMRNLNWSHYMPQL